MAPDPQYFTQGILLFGCTITVFTGDDRTPATTVMAASSSRPTAPDSDMMEQLGKIYGNEDGAAWPKGQVEDAALVAPLADLISATTTIV